MLITMVNIISIIIMLYISISALKSTIRRRGSIINFIILIIFFFNSIPVILDVIVGVPQYQNFYIGFIKAANDELTCIIYDLYIVFVLSILHIYSKRHSDIEQKATDVLIHIKDNNIEFLFNYIIFLIILLPVFHIIFSPYLEFYYQYGTPAMRGFTENEKNFTEMNTYLRLISIVFLAIWLSYKDNIDRIPVKLSVVFFSILLIWIDGKRNIIAIITLILTYIYWYRDILKGKELLKSLIVSLSVILIISFVYQSTLRKDIVSFDNFEDIYSDYRINFGRDDVVKVAIYSELYKDIRVLEYRGQSIISTVLIFIPRSIWTDKPLQHYNYITCAVLGIPPQVVSWGITPSVFDQLVANLGLWGMLIAPFLIIYICRTGGKLKDSFMCVLILLIISAMLTMGIDYIFPIIIAVVVFNVLKKVLYLIECKRQAMLLSFPGERSPINEEHTDYYQ